MPDQTTLDLGIDEQAQLRAKVAQLRDDAQKALNVGDKFEATRLGLMADELAKGLKGGTDAPAP